MSRSASLFRRLSMALVFVFLYAPILVLIVFSFNDSSSRSVWAGFTLDWYRELLRDDLILDAFYTTLAVSVLAAPCGDRLRSGSTPVWAPICPPSSIWASAPCSSPTSPSTSPM